MKQEKIRLFPTGQWILFGPILGCMWLAAVNYANNLVYAILYLVGSLCLVSIMHTWRNLASLRVEHIRIHPAFASDDVRVEIFLHNVGKAPIYSLVFLRVGEASAYGAWPKPTRPIPLLLRGTAVARIAAGDSRVVEVTFPSARRGLYRFENLVVKSSFPLGLFWASFRAPVELDYYVYPKAVGTPRWPALRPSGESGSPTSRLAGDDFSGVRTYSPGDPLRHVDWKAYARGRPLSVKQFSGGGGRELWLDATELGGLTLEARLSQLTVWIVNAEKEEIPYALSLGRTTLPLGLGPAQSRRALEALAVAGSGSERPSRA